jgi:predicted translation initiation factor SUI1
MATAGTRLVLFLGGEAAQRAATWFNAVVAKFGLPWRGEARPVEAAGAGDLSSVLRIVAVEALPVLSPEWADRIERWESESEDQVNQLVARLLGGGGPAPDPVPAPVPEQKKPAKDTPPLKVGRETKGRKGKGVTIVWDIPLDEAGVRALAAKLKERCGTGGTVEEGRILIQGDQRERVIAELEKLGYRVKRVGG